MFFSYALSMLVYGLGMSLLRSDYTIVRLNEMFLSTLEGHDVEYAGSILWAAANMDGISPAEIMKCLRNFDFEADTIKCRQRRRGFIYTDKYCLSWRILYRDKFGAALTDWSAIKRAGFLDLYVLVEEHYKLDEGDDLWRPNSTVRNLSTTS